MSKNYTENMEAEMLAIGSFTYETAKAYAEANGLKIRSVIAKAKSLKLEYTPKERVTKSGAPVVRKEAVILMVETKLDVPAGFLIGLQKSTKTALIRLFNATQDQRDEVEEVD